MLKKHNIDPMARFGGRLSERTTLPLSLRIEGAAAREHDLQEQNNQEPGHTTPQQHESNRYKQQPIQR
jgi:hypothetical protein